MADWRIFTAKDVPKVFEAVKDEQSQKDFKEANDAAIKAVKDFDAYLAEQRKNGERIISRSARTNSKRMLKHTEGVDIDLAKIEEIGKQDLERNTNALKARMRKICPGSDLSAMYGKGFGEQSRRRERR